MSDPVVLRRIALSAYHVPTGRTRHYVGGVLVGKPAALEIAKYPHDPGYYLFYLDEQGNEQTDTYHATLDDALRQAESEFQVRAEEWEVCGET